MVQLGESYSGIRRCRVRFFNRSGSPRRASFPQISFSVMYVAFKISAKNIWPIYAGIELDLFDLVRVQVGREDVRLEGW
jgi:hypothetical protein